MPQDSTGHLKVVESGEKGAVSLCNKIIKNINCLNYMPLKLQ